MAKPPSNTKLNLAKAAVLIVQNNQAELDMLGQVFMGFGIKTARKYLTVIEAESVARTMEFDLIVMDGDIGDEAFDFVWRLRRNSGSPNWLAPILLVTGHTPPSAIKRARDCGASYVVAKPITPKVLLDRIMWLARDQRDFVECETYVGPCRRVKAYGPPPGMAGRRKDDLPAEVGRPVGPDMGQAEIDALLTPRRAAVA